VSRARGGGFPVPKEGSEVAGLGSHPGKVVLVVGRGEGGGLVAQGERNFERLRDFIG